MFSQKKFQPIVMHTHDAMGRNSFLPDIVLLIGVVLHVFHSLALPSKIG